MNNQKLKNLGIAIPILFIVFLSLTLESVMAQNMKNSIHNIEGFSTGFIENKGQIIDQNNNPNLAVKYLYITPGLNIQLKSNSFSYDAYQVITKKKSDWEPSLENDPHHDDSLERIACFQRIDIEFIGANPSPKIVTENPSEDYINYYTTSLAESGAILVRHFGKITYKDLYPGIDLEFVAQPGTKTPFEYNFIIHPGANISLIRWKYNGSEQIDLVNEIINIKTDHGLIKEHIPLSYELETGVKSSIIYKSLSDGTFAFEGKYNNQNTLIIDPVPNIQWASYYGGSSQDKVNGVSYDSIGNVYITGETTTTSNMATTGSHQSSYAGGTAHYNWGGDAFVAKLNLSGTRVWGTYYGGNDNDQGNAIVTTKNGDTYVTGCSESTSGIATTGAFQTTRPSSSYHNPFLVKFSSSGTRQWGTYYGSGGNDHTYNGGITLDDSNNVFITGSANCVSSCKTIATSGAYQTQNSATGTGNAYNDAFVAKFSPSGSLVWGSYFGGNRGSNQASHDQGYTVFVDDSFYVYIAGTCQSSVGIATTGAHQTTFGGSVGTYDGFVAKFNSDGSQVMWATFYGGTGNDNCKGITADKSGYVYVSGYAASTTAISTSGSFQATYGGGSYDAFLVKFNQTGTRQWGTYYGAGGTDVFSYLSLNESGDLIVTGYCDSISAVTGLSTTGTYQPNYAGGTQDGIIAKFSTSGSRKWCSYFGGNLQDLIYDHKVDPSGNIYIGGLTFSTTGIATTGTHLTSQSGQEDGFVAKLTDQLPIMITDVTTIQPDTTATPAGAENKMIIGLKISTTGSSPFAKVTQFTFDTAGVFNYSNITGTAKVYYTGIVDTFNTSNLFDSTSSTPTSAFTFSGSQILDTGTVYFWLTFDVAFNAGINSFLDAKCTQMKWDSSGTVLSKTPTIISPSGKIRISAPLKKISSINYTQPNTDNVYRYSTDNPVIRIDLNVIGTAGTLNLNQLKVGAVNTNNSDVGDVKLYYTTSATFSNSNPVGSASSITNGFANFSAINFDIPSGMGYIWVTYDIPGSATIFDTIDAKIPAYGISIGGKSYPVTEQNPFGKRIIFTNFQYDAGISAIINPDAPYCKTNQDIKIRLDNYGITTLTSDTIRWTINGVAQTPYIWNGSLLTGTYTYLTIDNYTFTMGTPYTVKVFTSYVNGIYPDSYHQNDTATRTFTFYPTPVVGFTVNDSFQCFKGNSFEFTNTTTSGSGPFTSLWEFGDASSSTNASPTHSYQNIDTFPVLLVVTSAYGCSDSMFKNVLLKPNQTTDFSMSDTAACLRGNMFNFTNNTSFGSGTFTSLWKFGDNSTSTSISPSHSYSASGNYSVKLITTTNTGCIDSINKMVYVNIHPVSSFQFSTDTAQCFGNNQFQITNSTAISSGTFTNLWSFGDNSSSTNATPTKSYSSEGTYIIKLVTTSDYGCQDSTQRTVIIWPNPNTSFSINNNSQCRNTNNFVFTNNSSISSGTFTNLWNFGDMTTSTNTSASKTYNATGTFDVKLVTESNFGCKDSISQKVYINPNTGAYFTINDSDQCLKGNYFQFNNYSTIISGSFTNSWTFGDNSNSAQKSPSKNYLNTGTYTVKLRTTSNYGCLDSFVRKVYIRPHPVTSFSVNDSGQCLNSNNFIFTNNSSIPSGTFTSLWKFGDNTSSTINSPQHSYTIVGTFKVNLTNTSNYGCTESVEKTVITHPLPYSFFNTGKNNQCLESNFFKMDNHSGVGSGSLAHTYWDFGDGDTSSLYNPSHKYGSIGTFKVTLIVISDIGCSDTSSRDAFVLPQPQAGMLINDTALCMKNNLFQFTDDSKTSSGSITGFYWNFGDGKTDGSQNTSHSFTYPKPYIITHIVTASNGCKDTIKKTIFVYEMPVALFDINDSIQCQQGNLFIFSNQSTPNDGSLDYQWTFGDGGSSTDTNISHAYINIGNYNIQLITVTPENCMDTFERNIRVKEHPIINLGNDTTLYQNQSITLNAGGSYDSYLWSTNETSKTIMVDTNGIGLDNPTKFWVKAILEGCEGSDSINITFIQNISIKEQDVHLNILVYPNPANDFINLQSDHIVKDMTINLTDMNGKILISKPFKEQSQLQLDVKNLANGIYFLNLITKENTETIKIIKY